MEIDQGAIKGANGTEQSVAMDTSVDVDNTGTDTIRWYMIHKGTEFWEWVKNQMKTSISDKLTQFWAQMLWHMTTQ